MYGIYIQGSNTRFAEWLPSDDITVTEFVHIERPDQSNPKAIHPGGPPVKVLATSPLLLVALLLLLVLLLLLLLLLYGKSCCYFLSHHLPLLLPPPSPPVGRGAGSIPRP